MTGRDPHEPHRVATPLELLYDLVFVVALGVAGNQLAHALAAGHVVGGVVGFVFVVFAVVWAWMTFVWFASAYDTDDWLYRLLAMVQMMGVTLLALGIPAAFQSFETEGPVHNELLVAGYVVMRLGLLAQFLRASRHDPGRRPAIFTYVTAWTTAQVGWIVVLFVPFEAPWILLVMLPLYLLEVGTPWLAERKGGIPWHAGHLAERFSLFVIIALGEGVVGTVAALAALVDVTGWSRDSILLLVAGLAVTFGMWWVYFVLPLGPALEVRPRRSVSFGFSHLPLYLAIAAVGAGLHVVAYLVDPGHAGFEVAIGPVGTALAVAVPLGIFVLTVFALYTLMLRVGADHDAFHTLLLVGSFAVLVLGVGVVAAGAPVTVGILVIALAPFVTVVGYEVLGHRHAAADLEELGRR